MEEVPMRVIINPRLTVTDSQEVTARESCCSVQGMSAIVPRAKAVKVNKVFQAQHGLSRNILWSPLMRSTFCPRKLDHTKRAPGRPYNILYKVVFQTDW